MRETSGPVRQLAWHCAACPAIAPNLEALDWHVAAAHPHTSFALSARLRQAERELDLARAELASAVAELDRFRTRPWIVARTDDKPCEACDQRIRRGEAYVHLGAELYEHVHCPDQPHGKAAA